MRVAVPLFGNDVAPRFGFADSFLIVEISNKRIVREDRYITAVSSWVNRLGELKDAGIEIILCGGFNRTYLPLAEQLGMQVIPGLVGDARETVEAFLRGEARPTFVCEGMGFGARGGRSCGGKRGRGRGRL